MVYSAKLRGFILRYYTIAFCHDLILVYPVYAILFSRNGLSILQISLLMIWWCVTSGIFEVPSGALADRWQRKYLLAMAPLIKSGCFVLWAVANGSFMLYAFGFTLWSLGSSFASGTREAILYDTLRQNDDGPHEYERVRGRERICSNVACGIAFVCGGVIAQHSMVLTLGLSVPPLICASLVALSLAEPGRLDGGRDLHYLQHFMSAWNEIRANPTIRYTFLYQLFCIDTFGQIDEFDPLYFSMVGLPMSVIGAVLFSRMVLQSYGHMVAYRLKSFEGIEHIVPLMAGCILAMVGAFPSKVMIPMIILSYLLIAPVEILIDGKMQHAIDGNSRATVTSSAVLFTTILGLPLTMVFGLLSDKWGLGSGYVFFGTVLLASSFWVRQRRISSHKGA